MAAISRADGLVGELVDTLKRVGLYDDTVIVIAADHGGGQTGTHGRDAEPLRNVPFIISGPGILQNKTIDEREVRIFDVGATVVEVFGFSRPESWIATPVYEVFRSYVPPVAPPSSSPRITYVSEYQHVYDTSGELNAFLSTFSIWRVRSIFFFSFFQSSVGCSNQVTLADRPSGLRRPGRRRRGWIRRPHVPSARCRRRCRRRAPARRL